MNQIKYQIVTSSTLDDLEEETQKLIDEGWQLAGPIGYTNELYYHEMMKFPQQPAPDRRDAVSEFNAKLDRMDTKIKDLLDINGIVLACNPNGQLVTVVGEKVIEGISPNSILMALKNSKHCPIDLDEQEVLNAIEGVI